MEKFIFNIQVAFEAVAANLFRSFLTALGIIFGVGAVIAMLAVGNGAKKEILDQIKLVGVNNIVVTPELKKPGESGEQVSEKLKNASKQKYTGGLTLEDVESIKRVIPGISKVSPEVLYNTHAIREGKRSETKLVGVTPAFFEVFNYSLTEGRMFNDHQIRHGMPVCVIGSGVKAYFFSKESPLGKKIKVAGKWFTVVGVLEPRFITEGAEDLGIRDYNKDIFVPLETVLIRYKDRSVITKAGLERYAAEEEDDENQSGEKPASEPVNYNQLDKIVVQMEETEKLRPASSVISRMLTRRHNNITDFSIVVPELLLKQQQRTKNVFNIVLGAIAGISLLVGGIGIMNIMLASVWERIREIGVRQAVGATKDDVVMQFLSEAVIISLTGGIVGVIFGITAAELITRFTGILTIVSFPSVLLSFLVSATVGLIFGIMPAKRAAEQDPITSLRHE